MIITISKIPQQHYAAGLIFCFTMSFSFDIIKLYNLLKGALFSMDWFSVVLILVSLCLFEIVSSIDNAVINVEVLHTMSYRARKWFLTYGILFAVFFVRGLLPLFIVWLANPTLTLPMAFIATFSQDVQIQASLEYSTPLLMLGGGVFLLLLFMHWLFLEEKQYGLSFEEAIHNKKALYYTLVIIILISLFMLSTNYEKGKQLSAASLIGYIIFFITNSLKQNAEISEESLTRDKLLSDFKKIIYLEIIDATFSVDGVLGAFAFTMSVPLIILGNGAGAIVVRQLTLGNIDIIKKYSLLKNGAMYSIFGLSVVMILEGFGLTIPEYISPMFTILIILYFFTKSRHLEVT